MLNDLGKAVGPGMPNLPNDLRKVQRWLDNWETKTRNWIGSHEDKFTREFQQRIEKFQREIMGHPRPSGIVTPHDETTRKLQAQPPPLRHGVPQSPHRVPIGSLLSSPAQGAPLKLPPRTGFNSLDDTDYAEAAKILGCEVRMIEAMGLTEGRTDRGGAGFDERNRPAILYEPTHFLRYHRPLHRHPNSVELARNNTFRNQYPDLTTLRKKPLTPYGSYSLQWEHLQRAYLLDPRAALSATSWGKFQILGANYAGAGYATPEAMVSAMCASEQVQLKAFVSFIQSKHLQKALKEKNWKAIALGYNGGDALTPKHHYDVTLEENYNKLN